MLQLKVDHYYKTRDGNIAKIENQEYITDWPFAGRYIDKDGYSNLSWTIFGGYSDRYNGTRPMEERRDNWRDEDLVKELTKEDYPELYL